MTSEDRLSRIQARAIPALMSSRTILEAATASGVGEKTLRRWLASEPFASAYREAARESAREAVSSLLAAQRQAVETLRECLQADSPATRVRAARALLELGVRVGVEDMDQRIRQLEEEMNRWTEPPGALRLA